MNQYIFSQVSNKEILFFTKHLSLMLKSGITITEALDTLKQQTNNPAFKKLLNHVSGEISNGQNLKTALSQYPKVFSPLYLNLVGNGEESGNLEVNLEYLAKELQKTYEFNKKVSGAMLYPTLIVVVSLVIGGGISVFILPQLTTLFSTLDVTLPLATRMLLGFSSLMQRAGMILVPGILGFLIIMKYLVKTRFVQPTWDRLEMRLPIFRTFIQNSQSASLCRSLGLLLKSGLPITSAIKAVENGTENTIFRGYLHKMGNALEKGKAMGADFDEGNYKYLPAIVTKMVAVGEKTGKLDETLLYLGDFFADEVDDAAKNLPAILEPILLVLMAGMVLFLALAIISPIYDLTGSIGK